MPIDVSAAPRPIAREAVWTVFSETTQTAENSDRLRLLSGGRESLAVSSDAAALQRLTTGIASRLLLYRHARAPTAVSVYKSWFPAPMDAASGRPALEKPYSDERLELERFSRRLRMAFESEPLEDGMTHPAEKIIEGAIRDDNEPGVLDSLKKISLDITQPSFAASVLCCLGRLEAPGDAGWRAQIVREALATDEIEVRDAAAQAAESWGGSDMVPVLEEHSEPRRWLRDYIRDIVEDLRG